LNDESLEYAISWRSRGISDITAKDAARKQYHGQQLRFHPHQNTHENLGSFGAGEIWAMASWK